ncbi:MAG TPA: DUF3592 domain-containing protein [Pirellulales bacterium]|nr:DUF3592 domain-containing protein [Pirellulales bacterium]
MPEKIVTIKSPGTSAVAIGCLLFFALFWSALTLTFDGFIASSMVRQIQATRYPKVSGRVTQSSVKSHRGSKGRMVYSANLKFAYQVAGKTYQGHQYRYGTWANSDGNAARQTVAAYPVGRTVDVFYAPDDPSNAILKPGIEGADLFLITFMAPFNLIMLGIWFGAIQGIYRRYVPAIAGGAKITDDGYSTRIRFSQLPPLAIGLATMALLCFVGIFPIVILKGANPPLEMMYAVWALIASAGLIVTLLAWMKQARGDGDLVIDEVRQQITLPANWGRSEAVAIPTRDARAIQIDKIAKRGAKGSTYFCYAPILVCVGRSGSERREKLTEWQNQSNAEALAAWLRERLRIASPTPAA